MSVKDRFAMYVRYKVGSGTKIFFWHNVWIGDRALAIQFPELYRCARDSWARVFDYIDMTPNEVVWGPILRRNLTTSEESSLLSLLELIRNMSIVEEGVDCRLWTASRGGTFSVASFF